MTKMTIAINLSIMDVVEILFANGQIEKRHVAVQELDIESKFELIKWRSYGLLEFNNGVIALTEKGRNSSSELFNNRQESRRTA